MRDFESYLDREMFKRFNYFLIKVNERAEWQFGLRETYEEPKDDPALGPDVEFFHPTITYDDRMVYIMENIVGLLQSGAFRLPLLHNDAIAKIKLLGFKVLHGKAINNLHDHLVHGIEVLGKSKVLLIQQVRHFKF